MHNWLINCVAVLILCVFCAGFVIPQILLIAFRKKLFDEPDERKIHKSLVPRLGGIAFNPVILFSIFFVFGIDIALSDSQVLLTTLTEICPLLFGFCAMLILYLVGMADDLIGVKYRAKFFAQILCAGLLIAGGIWVNNFHGALNLYGLPAVFGMPFTILLIVFIINAINLIDGIDGLASGLSAIATLSYGIIFFLISEYLYAMISFATLGVLIPFFYYNVFGDAEKRKKIFMGDTGSLTIGIILSLLSIRMSMYPMDECIWHTNPLVLAFTPLFVPCCDVVRVYLLRVRNGKNPFLPDKTHIHHKLLAVGMHQRMAMVTIVLGTLLLVIANIFLSRYMNINILLLIDVLLWIFVNILLSKMARNKI
ncbi:undecaprenyl/decaprenyl-phosphate alpha-N-acetylglucosaminyl 1-phosphate transferase [bacterium]|nr:undecaprenyl/decaprenyl-phosphate alpha-N-acetylglucosaminyl 1-phosphate transferase [bacterium]